MRIPVAKPRRIALVVASSLLSAVGGCADQAGKPGARFANASPDMDAKAAFRAPAGTGASYESRVAGEVISADDYGAAAPAPTPKPGPDPALMPGRPGGHGGMGGAGMMGMGSATKSEAKSGMRGPYGNDTLSRNRTLAQAGGEKYARLVENQYRDPAKEPLSTFSVDVDTASYSNVRRFLNQGMLPPADAVRVEELINYFPYAYPQPTRDDEPFSVNVEVARCPWDDGHRLAKIGLKGREVAIDKRPASNLVFLIDVSGSMMAENKLPLVKSALRLLVGKLGENDRVAIVVYAGASGLVLPSTSCQDKATVLAALEELQAGGSTNGGAGLELAYNTAVAHFIKGGTNRVLLCTDGDFNVGVTGRDALLKLIEAKARSGVFLSVLGFGMGNYKDATINQLADKGNGNAAYIDSIREAAKVLVEQMGGTLLTIAKDVKVQVEFNPAKVASYRLIGYEDRILQARDFNDDKKDAGEIGSGHTVTALYEIVPAGREANAPGVDPLRYAAKADPKLAGKVDAPASRELFTVKLRHKPPQGDESRLIAFAVEDDGVDDTTTDDFRFAAAVAEFGLLLRDSPFKGHATWDDVLERAESAAGADPSGHRREFLGLARKARAIDSR